MKIGLGVQHDQCRSTTDCYVTPSLDIQDQIVEYHLNFMFS